MGGLRVELLRRAIVYKAYRKEKQTSLGWSLSFINEFRDVIREN